MQFIMTYQQAEDYRGSYLLGYPLSSTLVVVIVIPAETSDALPDTKLPPRDRQPQRELVVVPLVGFDVGGGESSLVR